MKYRLYQRTENGIFLAGEEKTFKAICDLAKIWDKTLPEGEVLLITKVFPQYETSYRIFKRGRPFYRLERYLLVWLKGEDNV